MNPSQYALAEEFSKLLRELQVLLNRGERLAAASGGVVRPETFRGARAILILAAGDLDVHGMLLQEKPTHPVGEGKEIVG